MKKILIASACAFTLCFTSCASKTAPETESQTEAPDTVKADAEETEATSDDSENTASDEVLSSDSFPELEVIEEPEIITLEPVEDTELSAEDTEPASEEVETEEPPVISEIEESSSDEENKADEAEDAADTTETTESENNSEGQVSEDTSTETPDVVIDSSSDDDGITVIGGGIDITDEDSDSDEDYSDTQKTIVPSRSITLKKFEYLDVTYPGTGWIYMGLTDNSKDIAYFGRKLGTKDTKFTLQARTAGTKIVHFYRNDPLTGKYLDDYLEIVILAENGSNKTHIEAPEYKLPVQKKEIPVKPADEDEASEKEETASETPAPVPTPVAASKPKETKTVEQKTVVKEEQPAPQENQTNEPIPAAQASDSTTLLKEAQLLYNEKEYAAALNKLNQFFEYSTDNRDEALYLKGQILEAKSNIRDIKGSIEAYTSLTKNYPASKYWDSANKRIIYLKRFYMEVR